MARSEFKNWAVDEAGNVIASAAFEVRWRGDDSLVTTLYNAATGSGTVGNPGTATSGGLVNFWLPYGEYEVTIGSGASAITYPFDAMPPIDANRSFASRADAVTEWTAMVARGETPAGGTVWSWPDFSIVFMPAGHGLYGTDPIADLAGWAPYSSTSVDHHEANANPGTTDMADAFQEAQVADAARGYRLPINLSGRYAHSEPIISDNERSLSFVGGEKSNLIDPASTTEYTGTGVTATVTSATNANPAVFTATSHGLSNGDIVWFKGVSGGTWQAAISGGPWTVANATTNTFTIADAEGTALDGTSLGTLSAATARTPAAMAGWHLTGAFAMTFQGLVMRTTQAVENIVRIEANDYFGGTDFSGSINTFRGAQFAPKGNDVTDALVRVANTKFTGFHECWFSPGPTDATRGLTLGIDRDDSRNTLMTGVAANSTVQSSFLFNDLVYQQAEGLVVENSQFDATDDPIRMRPSGDGRAAAVSVRNTLFTNDGGADASGLAALTHEYADYGFTTIVPGHGWVTEACIFRDWPIGMVINGGHHRVAGNVFRAQLGTDVGIQIGPNAYGESIDQTNSFLMMTRNSAVGIDDLRYQSVTITGATQANPVVISASGGHHFNNGDRVLIENVGGMTELNGNEYIVQNSTATTFELYSVTDGSVTSATVNGSAYTAYTSGGTVKRPYMWHMNTDGPQDLVAGHSDMVIDLELAELMTLSAGGNTVFDQENVMLTGGHYEININTTVIINATGQMRFKLTIDGTDVKESYSAFTSNDTSDEVNHSYIRRFYIPGSTSNSGVRVRLVATSPGANQLRGRASGTLGTTFMQIRRVA